VAELRDRVRGKVWATPRGRRENEPKYSGSSFSRERPRDSQEERGKKEDVRHYKTYFHADNVGDPDSPIEGGEKREIALFHLRLFLPKARPTFARAGEGGGKKGRGRRRPVFARIYREGGCLALAAGGKEKEGGRGEGGKQTPTH